MLLLLFLFCFHFFVFIFSVFIFLAFVPKIKKVVGNDKMLLLSLTEAMKSKWLTFQPLGMPRPSWPNLRLRHDTRCAHLSLSSKSVPKSLYFFLQSIAVFASSSSFALLFSLEVVIGLCQLPAISLLSVSFEAIL